MTQYNVYWIPEGNDPYYLGRAHGKDEVRAILAKAKKDLRQVSEIGTPRDRWETHRAARDGVPVPSDIAREDDSRAEWYGDFVAVPLA